MTYPFGPTVTLISRGDPTGSTIDGYTYAPTSTTIQSRSFAPGGSTEVLNGTDLVTTQPLLVLPPGTDVTAVDQVIVNGDTYEVDGSPNEPISPWTAWNPGVVVKLKAWTG